MNYRTLILPVIFLVASLFAGYLYISILQENQFLKVSLDDATQKNKDVERVFYHLAENLKDSSDWDVVFQFQKGSKYLYSHRTILKAHSRYFANFFMNNNEQLTTINITDSTSDQFRFVLDLFYFGKFPIKPTVDSVPVILSYLDKYLIFDKYKSYIDGEFRRLNYAPFIHEAAGIIYPMCREKNLFFCSRQIQENVKIWRIQPFFNSTYVQQYSQLFTDYLTNFC